MLSKWPESMVILYCPQCGWVGMRGRSSKICHICHKRLPMRTKEHDAIAKAIYERSENGKDKGKVY